MWSPSIHVVLLNLNIVLLLKIAVVGYSILVLLVTDCDHNPCMHGSCMNSLLGYSCTCQQGYEGSKCDKCKQ